MPFLTVEKAIEEIRQGKFLIMVDDEYRENEGDFICAAETMTPEMVNFLINEGRGFVCVPTTRERLDELDIPLMVHENTALQGTAFMVTVDYLHGTSTGISVHDRWATINALADPKTQGSDLGRPGHMHVIRAADGGVLQRSGHTEAVVDLLRLAKMKPVGVLCEILNDDGTMARLPDLEKVAKKYGFGILTIESLIEYRHRTESLITHETEVDFPSLFGQFKLHAYTARVDPKEALALVQGDITTNEPVLVRVHSSCFTGDVLRSLMCDCGDQLRFALEQINAEGRGVFLYLVQEGRGIGLMNKLKAYALQQQGLDTVEANTALGFKPDARQYGIGSQILAHLGVKKIRLMTNNPRKIHGLEGFGLEVVERVPIQVGVRERNVGYLSTKQKKLGHLLSLDEELVKTPETGKK